MVAVVPCGRGRGVRSSAYITTGDAAPVQCTPSTAPDAASKGQLFSDQDTTRSIVLARTHLSPTTRNVLDNLGNRYESVNTKSVGLRTEKPLLILNDAQ